MEFNEYALVYGIALLMFAIVDAIWIGIISKDLYKHFLKRKLASPPNWTAAVVFYLLFIVGLVYFAIAPGLNEINIGNTALNGALYGFFTFSTYQLTNRATLKGWPQGIVYIDIAWGTIASFTASILTYVVYRSII